MGKRGSSKSSSNKRQPPHPGRSDEEAASLWQTVTRNIDPLQSKGRVPDTDLSLLAEMQAQENVTADIRSADQPVKSKSAKSSKPAAARQHPIVPKRLPDEPAANIDKRAVRKIGKGRSSIDARIDLHGMRQAEAHRALRAFLIRAAGKGHRMVLVITGKGGGRWAADGSTSDEDRFGHFVHESPRYRGVLRRSVPQWLTEPDLRAIVVGHMPAHVRHGGEGALYVQLRRTRAPVSNVRRD